MTRREYMEILRSKLGVLSEEEIDDAVSYYEDYFEEAGVGYDDQVADTVESPELVASTILGGVKADSDDIGYFTEDGFRTIEEEKALPIKKKELRDKRGMLILVIILAIMAAPILIPLCGSVLGVIFGILSAVFAVIFGVFVAGIALIIAGIAVIVSAVLSITSGIMGTMILVGVGLVLCGIGSILTELGVMIVRWGFPLLVNSVKKLCHIIFKGRAVRRNEE